MRQSGHSSGKYFLSFVCRGWAMLESSKHWQNYVICTAITLQLEIKKLLKKKQEKCNCKKYSTIYLLSSAPPTGQHGARVRGDCARQGGALAAAPVPGGGAAAGTGAGTGTEKGTGPGCLEIMMFAKYGMQEHKRRKIRIDHKRAIKIVLNVSGANKKLLFTCTARALLRAKSIRIVSIILIIF